MPSSRKMPTSSAPPALRQQLTVRRWQAPAHGQTESSLPVHFGRACTAGQGNVSCKDMHTHALEADAPPHRSSGAKLMLALDKCVDSMCSDSTGASGNSPPLMDQPEATAMHSLRMADGSGIGAKT